MTPFRHAMVFIIMIAVSSLGVYLSQKMNLAPNNLNALTPPSSLRQSSQPVSVATDAPDSAAEPISEPTTNPIDTLERLNAIAHPDDPMNPSGITGITDQDLATLPTTKVYEIIDQTYESATKSNDARALFIIGRAALMHGNEDFAYELLSAADAAGSAAASAYLADLVDTNEEAEALLESAADNGFVPAIMALQSSKTVQRNTEPDFSRFGYPELIKAFYLNETEHLVGSPLIPVSYVSAAAESMKSCCLFLVEDSAGLLAKLDARLPIAAGRALMTHSNSVDQIARFNVDMLTGVLGSMAEVGSNDGSIIEKFAAFNRAMYNRSSSSRSNSNTSYTTIMELKEIAAKDGQLLTLLSEQEPEMFAQVYAGMRKFIYEDMLN